MLDNKTAFITGGSKGIGLAIVKACVQHGSTRVAYFSRTKSVEHDAIENEAKGRGSTLHHFQGDASDETVIRSAIEEFAKMAGSLDILVNNAGITRDKLIIGMKNEDWSRVIDLNLSAVFYACRAATKIMIRQRSGSIINISSVVALTGNPGQTNYCASKAGIIGLSKSLAQELAKRGIRVNVIAPGFIATEMTELMKKEQREKLIEHIPFNRVGTTEEVAQPCVFFASEMASYITGQVVCVAGGFGA